MIWNEEALGDPGVSLLWGTVGFGGCGSWGSPSPPSGLRALSLWGGGGQTKALVLRKHQDGHLAWWNGTDALRRSGSVSFECSGRTLRQSAVVETVSIAMTAFKDDCASFPISWEGCAGPPCDAAPLPPPPCQSQVSAGRRGAEPSRVFCRVLLVWWFCYRTASRPTPSNAP